MVISTNAPKIFAAIILALAAGIATGAYAASDSGMSGMDSTLATEPEGAMDMNMGMDMAAGAPAVPPVFGYIDGEQMLFIHTEISDAAVGKILTDMMGGSPVPVVPSLAKAPSEMLAPVYVFANGYSGTGPMGPLGGQPDIFDGAPGEPGYSPLRNIILVTWGDGANVRVLKSVDELDRAIDGGEVRTSEPGIVVNMPFLTWPGGSR